MIEPMDITITSPINVDGEHIATKDLIDILRREGKIREVIQYWIIERELKTIKLDQKKQNEILIGYREANNLGEEDDFNEHLNDRHINQKILQDILNRPYKVIAYREKRWGPAAESLYLKHKEKYDYITYWRIESEDSDLMQEIYFRLKDGEDTWDNLAKQFPGANENTTAKIGPIAITEVEEEVVSALKSTNSGRMPRPIRIGTKTIVVKEESYKLCEFNEELKMKILRQEFETWISDETKRLTEKVTFTYDN